MDVQARGGESPRRIQIGSRETWAWGIAAIVIPFSTLLDPIGVAFSWILQPFYSYPVAVVIGAIVVLGLLTWYAKTSPSGTSIRVWVAVAWLVAVVGGFFLAAAGILAVVPIGFHFFGPFIVLIVWLVFGAVVSPLLMLGLLGFASSRFVPRPPASMDRGHNAVGA